MLRYTVVMYGLLTVATVAGPGAQTDDAGLQLRMLQGRPVVDGVFVNGHGPYRFLVDTGTTLNHLDPRIAQSIGLKATFRTDVVSATGVTTASGSQGVDVALGATCAEGQTFLLAGLDALHQIAPEIQGVLGQAFLSRFDYRIDVRAGRLTFGTTPAGLGSAGIRVPFRVVRGRPAISTSLGWLVLDSGAHQLVLFGVDSDDESYQMVTMAGVRRVGMVSRRLLIAGRAFWRGDAVGLAESAEAGVAGLLPLSFFRAVSVSNSGGYLVLD